MHSNRPETFNLPYPKYHRPENPAEYMREEAQQKLRAAQTAQEVAYLLDRLSPPSTPEGWYMYASVYSATSIQVEYSPDSTCDLPWSSIARTIAALRNAYHIPSLTRAVTGSGEWLSNQYTGSVTLADAYWPHDTLATLTLRISTGSALPPSCRIEETRKKIRKTVEVIERKVVCA